MEPQHRPTPSALLQLQPAHREAWQAGRGAVVAMLDEVALLAGDVGLGIESSFSEGASQFRDFTVEQL